jgi:hypothetical protein
MSYNPFNLNDLCNPTKLENYINPMSPLNQVLRHNNHSSSSGSSSYYQERKKKYIKTEEDYKSDLFISYVFIIIFIAGTIGGTIAYFK